MIWNIEDCTRFLPVPYLLPGLMQIADNAPQSWKSTTRWEAKLKDLTWSSGNEASRVRHEQWRVVFEKQLESTPFTIQAADPLFSLPLGEEAEKFEQYLDRDAVWNRYRTLSQFSVMEGDQLEVYAGSLFLKETVC